MSVPRLEHLLAGATPGPWTWLANGALLGCGKTVIASALVHENGEVFRSEVELLGGATDRDLIALAPVLAQAVIAAEKALAEIVASTDRYPADNAVVGEARKIARSALASLRAAGVLS